MGILFKDLDYYQNIMKFYFDEQLYQYDIYH